MLWAWEVAWAFALLVASSGVWELGTLAASLLPFS